MSNRRENERYNADMIFWMKLEGSEEEYHHFVIENISVGGILVDSDIKYESGQKVLLEFELPQHTDLIEAKADVRHVHQKEKTYQIGLKFTDVEGLSNEKLMEYLEDIFG